MKNWVAWTEREHVKDYWWPFAVRRHRLVTKLTPQQCYERLQPRVKPMPFWPTDLPSRYVRGEVYPTNFTIRKGIGYSNPLQTVAIGQVKATPRGSDIGVRLSADPASIVFLAMWGGGVLLIMFLNAWPRLASQPGDQTSLAFIIIPACMLLMGYGLSAIGRWLAADEGDRLLQFLKTTLHAEDVAGETT
jgi:hypothetical protein